MRCFQSLTLESFSFFFLQEVIKTPSSPRGNRDSIAWESVRKEICVGKGEQWYTFHGNLPTINVCTLRVENMVVFIRNYKSELITFLYEAFISKKILCI